MNHPPDHRDGDLDDDALPPHLRRLLDEGSDGPPLSRAAQERLLGRVLATVGTATVAAATGASAASTATSGVATTTATTATATTMTATTAATTVVTTAVTTAVTTTTTAATAGGLALSVKAAVLAAGVGLAGLTGVGVVAVVDRGPALPARDPVPLWTPPSSSSSSSASSSTAPVSDVAPASDVAAAPLPVSSSPPPSSPPKKPAVAPPALESSWEVPQLESARAALSAGRAAEALTLVEDHARRAPGSALREEGRALAVLALVALDRREDARAAAADFAVRHPHSLFLPRVQRAVSSSSSP